MSDGNTKGQTCAETPAVSALSPSGARLAFAINTPTDENVVDSATDSRDHLHRPASPRRQDSVASDGDCPANPPLVKYRVMITSSGTSRISSKSAAAAEEKTQASSSSLLPSSTSSTSPSSAANYEVATSDVKAPVTTLQWLDESHLACGLQDGTVVIIARRRSNISSGRRSSESGRDSAGDWTPTLSRCFHRAQADESSEGGGKAKRVVCIRLSGEGLAGGGVGGATGAARGSEPTLWVLYGDRVVVCVSVEAVIALAR